MKDFKHCLIRVAALLLATTLGASPPNNKGGTDAFVVHEWGTFLTMNGSDGVALDSMYHEEHALPGFVHAVNQKELRQSDMLMKGETPVIYFYTHRPRTVRVQVKFPYGMWTQWYPQAHVLDRMEDDKSIGANIPSVVGDFLPLRGCISWDADLIPADSAVTPPALPEAPRDLLWNFARQVDAAYVRAYSNQGIGRRDRDKAPEAERFLFYRGLGRANLPLAVSSRNGGTLSLSSRQPRSLTSLFVLRVEGGKGAYRYVPSLGPGQSIDHMIPEMAEARPIADFSAHVADELTAHLEESGLYAKEARAMVNTWRRSYFQSPGVRVLYILPQQWTDGFIPLHLTPQPDSLVRVMVGRTELLTPEREQTIAGALRDMEGSDPALQAQALVTLRGQGRYIQPILRRFLNLTSDPVVRDSCRRLLKADWVNELRPATVTEAAAH